MQRTIRRPSVLASLRLRKPQARDHVKVSSGFPYPSRIKKWAKPTPWGPRQRENWPTFGVSNLLLDLDAADLKGVRLFDEQRDGKPEHPEAAISRDLLPVKQRIAAFEEGYRRDAATSAETLAREVDPLHVTDFDVLAAVLIDMPNAPLALFAHQSSSPVDASATHADDLRSVLDGNGIPQSVRKDPSNTVAYLQRYQSHKPRSLGPGDHAILSEALGACTTFVQIDRLITRLMHTTEGCLLLSNSSNELHEFFTHLTFGEPHQLLSLLNALSLNFDRLGLPMTSSLLALGTWASLKCPAIATAHQYIKRSVDNRDLGKRHVASIVETLAQILSVPANFNRSHLNPKDQLMATYSLLTGYTPGESQQTVSLRSLMSRDGSIDAKPEIFRLYIECLARLGAFRTIWHERWTTDYEAQVTKTEDLRLQEYLTERNAKSLATQVLVDITPEYGYQTWFGAVMLDALRRNDAMSRTPGVPGVCDLTGQPQRDFQLDMASITRSESLLPLLGEGDTGPESSPDGLGFQLVSLRQILIETTSEEEAVANMRTFLKEFKPTR
ncbi:hypothetical protein F4808DRAFT_464306 [Astrocystis sublimbata]|nr:hypothetical protein F4808DRAFT_464306 [Astrocystis sublimbata]